MQLLAAIKDPLKAAYYGVRSVILRCQRREASKDQSAGGLRPSLFEARATRGHLRVTANSYTKLNPKMNSLLCWCVEDAVDLDDVIVEEALNLEHGTRRIRRLAPKFRLYFAHEGREPMQIGHVDREADAILQCRARRFGNEFQIQESLANTRLSHLPPICWWPG